MNLLIRLWLPFALIWEYGYPTRYLDWCQYWRALRQDHLRPECNGVYRVSFSRRRSGRFEAVPELKGDLLSGFHRYKAEVNGISSLTKRVLGIDECSFNYNFCRASSMCDSGSICVGTSGYCCAPLLRVPRECPHPAQLVTTCMVTTPVNWCSSNLQCGSSHLCCPTRCGYNVCT